MRKSSLCEATKQILIDFLPIIEREQIELDSSIPDEEINILADKDSFVRIVI